MLRVRTLDGDVLVARLQGADGQRQVVIREEDGTVVAALDEDRLARVGRLLRLPRPSSAGSSRVHEVGPVDVARLKLMPTAHRHPRGAQAARRGRAFSR